MPHKDLPKAVALFDELGWATAQPTDTPTLDIGTKEQQAVARRGLSTGNWEDYQYQPEYRRIDYLDGANEYMMTLFALRLGVAPKRIISIFRRTGHSADYRLIAELVALQGEDYARKFIAKAARYNETEGMEIISHNEFNISSFFLVTHHFPDFSVPEEPNYLAAWALCAAKALQAPGTKIFGPKNQQPKLSEITPNLVQHLDACIRHGVPLWDGLGYVVIAALNRGLISRETALTAAITGLDAATRPMQRRRMLGLLVDDLGLSDADVAAHSEAFSSIASTAEPTVISAIGLRLIGVVAADSVGEVSLPMLYVSTLKGQREVLAAIAARTDITDGSIAVLTDRVRELSQVRNEQVAQQAQAVLDQWGVGSDDALSADGVELYPWNNPPECWQVPRFERIEPTYDALVEALTSSDYAVDHDFLDPIDITTTESEQYLVAFAQLALNDVEAAQRISRLSETHRLWQLQMSRDESEFRTVTNPFDDLMCERNRELSYVLGSIPCIVSEPSFVDLSISFADLLERFDAYEAAGVSVLFSDLLVALCRLNLAELNIADAVVEAKKRGASVIQSFAHRINRTAGEILAEYILSPLPLPKLTDNGFDHISQFLEVKPISVPDNLAAFVKDFDDAGELFIYDPGVFPTLGDAVWRVLGHRSSSSNADQGLLARQVARSATALGPGTAMNLIGLARPTKRGGISLAHQAITDAWQRGLLRPGAADPKYLDWDVIGTKNFSGFADVALELTETGLLAVAWQLLDDILSHAPKPTSKTVEIAEMMLHLAPSVAHAIASGAAPQDVAAVTHLRRFAAMSGKNKTSQAAREAVALLPEPDTTTNVPAPIIDLDGWDKPAPEVINDTVDLYLTHATETPSAVTVGIRGMGDKRRKFEVSMWDFEMLPKVNIYKVFGYLSDEYPNQYHMRWDGKKWQLQKPQLRSITYKDWNDPELPIFASVVYILFGMMHSGSRCKNARECMERFLVENKISTEIVSRTIRNLVGEELWTPVQALKLLSTDAHLPVLWPLLTETIAFAATTIAAGHAPPKWLAKILDCITEHSGVLAEATAAGYIPPDAWEPISVIAQQKKKTAAVKKATSLLAAFGISS
ncbi:MAG: hypothetical protein Q4D85_07360 [Corynebacterium sp.]|uniref:hypothetical protein n=1 Tax=Corynebacterium sp. TaxID=1720 RepID=UPI0026DAF937|nr:hypothetical protein [Corynebacterium sp.]MDO5098565.1 hypothetical protein [Corynebacterium sp.]